MNELQVIHEQMLFGKQFKIYGTKEEPLFLAKDVAEWIEHSNTSKMISNIDEEEKVLLESSTITNGYSREENLVTKKWFLTENGLYEVLMLSRQPIAKQFKKQVKEILKSIRKHGAYMAEEVLKKAYEDPDFMIGLLTKLKEEKESRKLAEQKVIELQPKAEKFERVVDSNRLLTFEAVANMTVEHCLKTFGVKFELNRLTFPALLRDMGILSKERVYKGGAYKNTPRKGYQEFFAVKCTEWGDTNKSITRESNRAN